MSRRPHWAGRVVEDLRRHRTREQTSEEPEAVRRHHDQVNGVALRESDRPPGGVSRVGEPFDGDPGEVIDERVIESALELAFPFRRVVTASRAQAGRRGVERRRHHRVERDPGVEAGGERLDERSGLHALRREIEREEDVGDRGHT